MNRPDSAADMIYGESFHDGDIVVALTSLKNLCSERAEIHSGKSFMNLYVETLVLLEYNLQDKFESICRISDNLVYVLKHPGFEQLYYEKKDSKQ